MIEFSVSESDRLIQDTVKRFAKEHLAPNARTFESDRSVSSMVRSEWEKLGLSGLEIPEEFGGSGCNPLTRCLVNEALGSADSGAALDLDPIGAAIYPVLEMGSDADQQLLNTWGKTCLIYAPSCDVRLTDDKCSGRVAWVHSDRVDQLLFLDEENAWVVSEGFTLAKLRGSGLRASGASSIELEMAPVSKKWNDPVGSRRALARSRIYYGAILLGLLDQISEYSRNYARERMAFGKPVAHHQAMAFLMIDMNTAVTACRLQLHYAATLAAEPDTSSFCEAAATAWAELCDAAAFIGPNGVQILGGVGFMQDYPVEKYMREARALSLIFGGKDSAIDDSSQLLKSSSAPQLELVRGLL